MMKFHKMIPAVYFAKNCNGKHSESQRVCAKQKTNTANEAKLMHIIEGLMSGGGGGGVISCPSPSLLWDQVTKLSHSSELKAS